MSCARSECQKCRFRIRICPQCGVDQDIACQPWGSEQATLAARLERQLAAMKYLKAFSSQSKADAAAAKLQATESKIRPCLELPALGT